MGAGSLTSVVGTNSLRLRVVIIEVIISAGVSLAFVINGVVRS